MIKDIDFLLTWHDQDKLNEKIKQLSTISDYQKVYDIGQKSKIGDIYPSTRKNSKYMVWNPLKGKYVHFGSINYQDYTFHENKERRDRFRTRNKKWADADIFSPAFLSYYILW